MKYFSNLPIISYANSYARNILTRVKFVEEFKDISQAYYHFVQQEGSGSLRYEDLSYDYYDDAEDVWIIHLFNEVIDPYYDCTLSQADFDNFKPILSANPTISKSDDYYNLSFNAIVPLPKGLYYFIIEDNEIEDMIYVGKFLVE